MKHSLNQYLFLALITALACSPDKQSSQRNTVNIGNASIEISDAWARPANAGMMTAAYFSITNNESYADTLLLVRYSNAADTQIHESFEAEGGMMGMRPVEGVAIPSGERVELKPGGIHIMIIRPEMNLAEGDTIGLELAFSSEEVRLIRVPVRSN
ncbi:MAG: copper chaperone PCu(A)C [bacterium]|nr:copper chaperone PCu(A)C [bacterium]